MYRLLGVLLILIVGCSSRNEQPTYMPYTFLFSDTLDIERSAIRYQFDSIPKPVCSGYTIEGSWFFSLGDSTEGLNAIVKNNLIEEVLLPHQVAIPNRACWYSKSITIQNPGILTLHADDGAQLFIEGKQVRRIRDGYFPIDTIGTLHVTIRVLNNAMSGGLKRVLFSTHTEFSDFEKSITHYQRLQQLTTKARLKVQASTAMLQPLYEALKNPTELSISNAELLWNDFPFFIGPWLQRVDSTTYRISVYCEGNHPVTLRYCESKNKLLEKQTYSGTDVSFTLPSLKSETVYFYQLSSAKTNSPVYSFKTGDVSAPFSFNVWADSQSGWKIFQQHILNTQDYTDAFGIGVGDLVSNGADLEHWKSFFSILSTSAVTTPYYLLPGNHDYDGFYDDLKPSFYQSFTKNNPPNYFMWQYGNAAFIALDPSENFPIGIPPTSQQYQWFKELLQSKIWRQATWRFVLLHQPPHSQGWEGYEGDQVIRDLIEPVLESAQIDFVISGHTHDYERLTKMYGGQQTTFLIVGGAGGSLEPEGLSPEPLMDKVIKQHHIGRFFVNDKTIRFEAVDLNKKMIDFFEQSK